MRSTVTWVAAALGLLLAGCVSHGIATQGGGVAQLADDSGGRDWPGFGRTYGEQHFSPLDQVNGDTVERLGLAWSLDLPPGNSATGPIAVNGKLYFASGYSVVHAVDAATGRLLWTHDPKVAEVAGEKLRRGWGSRGVAWWNGMVITATLDGRLIALDAATGHVRWTAQTIDKDDGRYVTGPPRAFDGKILIGHAGADMSPVRGYVTAYDAATGRQLWRFHTVPGNPADGFENEAMRMAAETWSGEWWKFGGGGTVWNAISYDRETGTVFIGTGNGAPWNHRIRSEGKGDNLFLCSIVALDAATGRYKWHYQVNPGETWDYNAAMDMELATIAIDGRPRKVLMTVPKNGFFYVIDRTNGKLISAEPIAKVNWASGIDRATGRPIENPAARFPDGTTFTMWPGGMTGAHSWLPMAVDPRNGVTFVPVTEAPTGYSDKGVDRARWRFAPGMLLNSGVELSLPKDVASLVGSRLVAWDAARQKELWRVPTPGLIGGGVLATAGGLVFQGHIGGRFVAYAAQDGRQLWSFDAQAPIIAPPISYRIGNRQYVTVITGLGTGAASLGSLQPGFDIQYRTQARRVLTFILDGKARLPAREAEPPLAAFDDPGFKPDAAMLRRGAELFGGHCTNCHGGGAIALGNAPDLRASPVVMEPEAFRGVVRDGLLLPANMPRFAEFDDADLEAIRTYIRARAAEFRPSPPKAPR